MITIIPIKLVLLFHLLINQSDLYQHEFRNDKFIVYYSIIKKNDSTVIKGNIKFTKTKIPAYNTNIWVEQNGNKTGTVPGDKGTFRIILRHNPSEVFFHLIPYKKFKIELE